jgi:hypothetical protein
MTTPLGDDSNGLPLPAANLLVHLAATLLNAAKDASPGPSDPIGLRIAKHGFRTCFVGMIAAGTAMFVLQPPTQAT